jgi:tetrahydromethanopterin S-methyltransferase subunit G
MSDYDKEVLTASALLERLDSIEARLKDIEEYKQEIIDAVQMVESLGELTSYHKLCFPSGMNGTNLVNEVHDIDDRLTHLEEKVDATD